MNEFHDGKVRVRHLRTGESQEVASRERQYMGTVAKQAVVDDIELFED